jgi:hypothetical protein
LELQVARVFENLKMHIAFKRLDEGIRTPQEIRNYETQIDLRVDAYLTTFCAEESFVLLVLRAVTRCDLAYHAALSLRICKSGKYIQ